MKSEELLNRIDHTVLKPFTSFEEVRKLCEECIRYQMASVCIPPSYVKRVKETYKKRLKVGTVIGFPLGYQSLETKVYEAERAIEDGADEIDMVINIAEVKNGNFSYVEKEIRQIRTVAKDKILKVIVETCYLDTEEKIRLCEIISRVKADYIKTSTGFGTFGANLKDIELFKQHISKEVKIKASGGIKTVKDMEAFIKAGCDRIGTSSGLRFIVAIL